MLSRKVAVILLIRSPYDFRSSDGEIMRSSATVADGERIQSEAVS